MKTVQTCTRTWWWCVSMCGARFAVFVRTARVLPSPSQATRNLSFLEVSAAPSRWCFKLLSHWTGRCWFEFPTEWNLCKRVRARSGGAWTCLAHALQCLRDRRACCPVVPKQLVICRFLRFHRRRSRCCFKSLLHWTGTCWFELPTKWNLYKRVRARSGGA